MRPTTAEIPPALRLLHDQLLLAGRREAWVGDAVAASLGQDALNVLATARRQHPVSLPESPDALSECTDPHGLLERAIGHLLAREAAGHRALMLLFGDDAEVRLRLAAFDHGLASGRERAAAQPASGPGPVFDALAGCVLEDLPGRSRVRLLDEEPGRVRWVHDACPYKRAWSAAAAPMRPACQILSAWIRGLASGIDPSVEYRRPRAIALGDPRCEHELVVLTSGSHHG